MCFNRAYYRGRKTKNDETFQPLFYCPIIRRYYKNDETFDVLFDVDLMFLIRDFVVFYDNVNVVL